MKYLKPGVILALFLVSMASSMLAWRQYQELLALRFVARDSAGSTDSSARLRELERLNSQLRAQLQARNATDETAPADEPAERPRGREDFARGGRGPGLTRELANNPQVQALRAVQQKAQLDQRYASLFRQLNLSPEKLSQFQALLAERQATSMDVMAAAREQGIDPRRNPDQFRQLMAAAQSTVDQGIKSLLGDTNYAEYQAYEQTGPQRATVSQLERRLSYTETPLTAIQSSQLVQILASTSPTPAATDLPLPPGGPGGGRGGPGGGEGQTAVITAQTVTQAATVLDPAQVSVLQQLQQQQQAQQQLRQLVGGPGGRGGRG